MTYADLKQQMAQVMASMSAEDLAEIDARSDAMTQTAAVYERVLADQVTEIRALERTNDDGHMLTRIAAVIALAQLRSAALGCDPPTWQEALERYHVLNSTVINAIKTHFKKEAASN